jgi:hypothetical protein
VQASGYAAGAGAAAVGTAVGAAVGGAVAATVGATVGTVVDTGAVVATAVGTAALATGGIVFFGLGAIAATMMDGTRIAITMTMALVAIHHFVDLRGLHQLCFTATGGSETEAIAVESTVGGRGGHAGGPTGGGAGGGGISEFGVCMTTSTPFPRLNLPTLNPAAPQARR